MQPDSLSIDGLAIHPTRTESSTIREHLKRLPIFNGYASEVDAVLNIMERCRHWLPEEIGAELSNAALQYNDAIYQMISHYGARQLVAQFRSYTGLETAEDVQVIAAFALANAVHALCGLAEHLIAQGQEIPALEYYQMHLCCIEDYVPGASAWRCSRHWSTWGCAWRPCVLHAIRATTCRATYKAMTAPSAPAWSLVWAGMGMLTWCRIGRSVPARNTCTSTKPAPSSHPLPKLEH